jgi:hypothetical protein
MTTTTTLPLSGQALRHLDEMAEHQSKHRCDMSGVAWEFLHILDYQPPNGPVFDALWPEFVRVSAGLRAALESGGPMWNWRVQAQNLLTALAGESR